MEKTKNEYEPVLANSLARNGSQKPFTVGICHAQVCWRHPVSYVFDPFLTRFCDRWSRAQFEEMRPALPCHELPRTRAGYGLSYCKNCLLNPVSQPVFESDLPVFRCFSASVGRNVHLLQTAFILNSWRRSYVRAVAQ